MYKTLLIELQVEELPPLSLEKLGEFFANSLLTTLIKERFAPLDAQVTAYASPRRLAAEISLVQTQQSDQVILKKGPSATMAYENDQPTIALMSFAKNCGVKIAQLTMANDGKQAIYVYQQTVSGKTLSEVLPVILSTLFKNLSDYTLMRWADRNDQFLRPIHGVMVLHGTKVVPCEIFGFKSSRITAGHRFLSPEVIKLDEAKNYASVMEKNGKVVASFTKRRQIIDAQLTQAAKKLNAHIANKAELIDEVTALVEWPVVLEAKFDVSFLRLPQECLILTMQQHQKYFPLFDQKNQLMNHFLLVSNLATDDPSYIIRGNERVIHARLSDAAFFFDQDQQKPLDSLIPQFEHIVYHNRLGNQLQRITRLQLIAVKLAKILQIDEKLASRAAYLCKADLLTNMIGEFPALQGVMGRYYAQHDGEDLSVANAIETHYYPRFSDDKLPSDPLGELLALTDKLEILVGIIGMGVLPTGDKDPFALRRSAIGVLRILLNRLLNLRVLCQTVISVFPADLLKKDTTEKVYHFCLERLKYYLVRYYARDVVEAVLALKPSQFDKIICKIKAVEVFKALPDVSALIAINKRVKNILHKSPIQYDKIDESLLNETAEQCLFDQIQKIQPIIDQYIQSSDYQLALSVTVSLKTSIDNFFDEVMVFVDDESLRNNRLALLSALFKQLNFIADIALLCDDKNN